MQKYINDCQELIESIEMHGKTHYPEHKTSAKL